MNSKTDLDGSNILPDPEPINLAMMRTMQAAIRGEDIAVLEQRIATLTAEKDEACLRYASGEVEIKTLTAERDEARSIAEGEYARAEHHLKMREEAEAERDALRAKIEGSYVQSCLIEPRPGDGPLFNGDEYMARLDGYVIVDRAKYDALRAAIRKTGGNYMKVYIAGPYTRGDVAANVRRAIEAGNKVAHAGHYPFIPHLTHFWHLIFPHEYEFWLCQDNEWLRVCDALIRLDGESHGADMELEMAKARGLKVFNSVEEFLNETDRV